MEPGPNLQSLISRKNRSRLFLVVAGCLIGVVAIISIIQSGDSSSLLPHGHHGLGSRDDSTMRPKEFRTNQGGTSFSLDSLASQERSAPYMRKQRDIGNMKPLEWFGTTAYSSDHETGKGVVIYADYETDDYQDTEILDVGNFLDADGENLYLPITLSGENRQEVGDFNDADGQFDDYWGSEVPDIGEFLDADDEHLCLPSMLSGENRQELGDFDDADDRFGSSRDSEDLDSGGFLDADL